MIVSNSTPLIYLARIGKLQFLNEFFKEVAISEKVWEEVVKEGKNEGCPDAFVVEKAMSEGWIKVHKTKITKKLENFGIDKGEIESISLTIDLKQKEILVDQVHARAAASVLGLKPRGTIFVLLKALKRGMINYEEYLDSLSELTRSNFRMSDDVYLEAIKLGKKAISSHL